MYRIALQLTAATTNKPATFQYLSDNGIEPWETEDEREGLKRFCSELDNYKRSILKLVKVIDIKCHCEDEDNIDVTVEMSPANLKVVTNDGTKFEARLNLTGDLAAYTAVAIDSDAMANAKLAIEALGLTNIEITKEGITATNPTGTAVEGSAYMVEGVWRLYSETTRQDNYITSAFLLQTDEDGDDNRY